MSRAKTPSEREPLFVEVVSRRIKMFPFEIRAAIAEKDGVHDRFAPISAVEVITCSSQKLTFLASGKRLL